MSALAGVHSGAAEGDSVLRDQQAVNDATVTMGGNDDDMHAAPVPAVLDLPMDDDDIEDADADDI